jgi:hypothetical protein
MIVPQGDTYYLKFTTRSFSTGAPATLSGTPAISVYEENNATQITSGITLTADYDSVTGLNDVAIVASSGNGYEVGKYYSVVITTGTVGGVSVVGEVVGHFRCGPAEASAGVPDVNVTHVGDTSQTAGDLAALITTVDGVVDNILTDTAEIGTAGAGLTNLGGSGNDWNTTTPPTAAAIADAVWNESADAHTSQGSLGELMSFILTDTAAIPTVQNIVDGVWDESADAHTAQGTLGELINDIKTDTAEIGTAGAGLTNINLPDQTMNITGNITGNLSGSVGSVTGNVGGVAGTITTLDALDTAQDTQHASTQADIAALNDLSAAEVNAEVVDALSTDTYAEPGQGAPAATASLAAKLNYLYKAWRNKSTQTATQYSLYADDTTTVDQKATVSDDGTTATKGEIATGP